MEQNLLQGRGKPGKPASLQICIAGILIVICMMLLAACGGGGSSGNSSAGTGNATPTQHANPLSLVKLVGVPAAKVISGTNFEVTGQVENMDKAQHDIFLQATLKDATGKVVGTAQGLADNVPAGKTNAYTLKGSLTQPTWSTVSVVITKISENVNGQGSD